VYHTQIESRYYYYYVCMYLQHTVWYHTYIGAPKILQKPSLSDTNDGEAGDGD